MRQICSCAFGRKDCKKRKGTMKPRLAKQMVKGLRLCENVTTTGRKRQMIHQQYEVDDHLHEECGVFGIYDMDGNDVASTIYYGLFALQQMCIRDRAKHLLAAFERGQVAALSSLDSRLADFTVVNSYAVNVQNMNTYREGFELLIKDLTHWKKEKYRIVLLCPSRTRANRIVNQLIEYDLLAYYSEDEDKKINPGEIMVTYGNLCLLYTSRCV